MQIIPKSLKKVQGEEEAVEVEAEVEAKVEVELLEL